MFQRYLTALLLLATAACSGARDPAVDDAYVRLAAVPGRPAAAYFTLHGGAADAVLTGIATPAAKRAELHESRMAAGGGMTMDALPRVDVPAGAEVAFAPAGRHAMLFDIGAQVKPGDAVPLTLTFADGRTVEAQARVIAAGDAGP